MSRFDSKLLRTLCTGGACLLGVGLLLAVSKADVAVSQPAAVCGNVDFDFPDAPPASMELDVSQGMFHDLFGIGDAAIAGAVESLRQAAGEKAGGQKSPVAAEQLDAVRQLLQLSGNLVQGVRVRVYELDSSKAEVTGKLSAYYDKKLHAGNWETVVRVHDDGDVLSVAVLRSGGAVKGLFVIGDDGDNLVLANVGCDISPENIKKLTAAAAKSGLDAQLGQALVIKVQELRSPTDAPDEMP
jgi:hypothetical protein